MSPTVTQTRIVFPYTIRITLYNEAGEVVKTIGSDTISRPLSDVVLYAKGVTNPASVSSDTPLEIFLPGVESPDFRSGPGVPFYWTTDNAQSQDIMQGRYYIKVEQTDEYGHVTAFIRDITFLAVEEYIELTIYNGAGEVVRTIRKYGPVNLEKADLKIDDLVVIENNGTIVNVKYGPNLGEYIQWDGRNNSGAVVSTGSYEIQVKISTMAGTSVSSKTVIVLRQEKEFLTGLSVIPSPFTAVSAADSIVFAWTLASPLETGYAYVRIYDITGGLVRKLKTRLENGSIKWDLRAEGGKIAGTGIYIAALECVNNAGFINRKAEKFAIAGYK